MNIYLQLKTPNPIIQIRSNDNAIEVKGQAEEGYINKSILKDDPELETKLTGLVEQMKTHQRQQLVSFCGEQAPALEEFDKQMPGLEAKINAYLEGI